MPKRNKYRRSLLKMKKKKLLHPNDARLQIKIKPDHEIRPLKKPLKEGAVGSRGENKLPVKFADPTKMLLDGKVVKNLPKAPTHLFLSHNTALGPPYNILLDTNFINHCISKKMDIHKEMMDTLVAKCVCYVCGCVISELEKLGKKYRLALKIAKDPQFKRIPCKNTYADDCLMNRAESHRCFMIATNDKDFQRRIRKVPGIPIISIRGHRFTVERMPEALGAPKV